MEFNREEFAHCSSNSLVRLIITNSLSCLNRPHCIFVSFNKAFCALCSYLLFSIIPSPIGNCHIKTRQRWGWGRMRVRICMCVSGK